MKLLMFSIRDSAVGEFMRPFFARSKGEAMRMFQNDMKNSDSMVHSNPEHFSLWFVGEFNGADGGVAGEVPECLCKAVDLIEH